MKIIETLTGSLEFHEVSKEPHVRMSSKSISRRDEINRMIDSGNLQCEEVSCLCGNDTFDLISEFDKFGVKQKTVICRKCGLVQSNPRMTKEANDWFYGSDFYGELYGRIEGKATTEFILSEAKNRPQDRYEFVKQNLDYSKVNSVLEIGCAGGWSLYPYFKDGKRVVGYDYGPALVEAGKKLGMDLRVGKIEDDKSENGKYDLIMMCHVYEHIPNPKQFLDNLKKYLAPGGHFYIEVPDMRELSINGLVNGHSYYYTKNTFIYYLNKFGLSIISYQRDDKKLGSQAGLFEMSGSDSHKHPLQEEYLRMKKIIQRNDKILMYRKKLKAFSKKMKVFLPISKLSHALRTHNKKAVKLETVAISERA